jgi:hypothetical protein
MLSGLVNTCHQQGFGTGIFNININTNMNIINNSYTFNNGSGTNNTNINNLKKLDNEVKYI